MSLFIAFFLIPIASAELVFVTVIHRHGDRTPTWLYPTDPYQEHFKEEGLGKLTNIGKNQLYDLGKFMRNRYSGFLPLQYADEDVHVEALDISRTLMSGYCALASLYEPHGDDIWSLTLKNWQPIPIYTLDKDKDNKLESKAPCPKYNQLKENIFENVISGERKQKLGELMANLSRYTGLDLKADLQSLTLTVNIHDALQIENWKNLTLPDWTVDFFPEPLLEIHRFASYELPYYNDDIKRLRCGPLLKEVIENFEKKINGSMTMKWWQYSAHDTTVAHILNCLNVYDGDLPEYASAVFLELYKNSEDYDVAVVYKKNDTTVENLVVPGCTLYCPCRNLRNW